VSKVNMEKMKAAYAESRGVEVPVAEPQAKKAKR
jgi:hypothetical protein